MEILIAEDEMQIAEPLRKNFLEEGHHAMIAIDGEQALSLLTKIQFDVIILDWKMPKLSGFEVCKRIRENRRLNTYLVVNCLNAGIKQGRSF